MAEISDEALDALAQAFCERLQVVVPEGAYPSVGAAYVWHQLDGIVNQPGGPESYLLGASEGILSDFQDQIIRDLKEGWPRSVNGNPGERDAGIDLPQPEAAKVSGALRLWYGDARRPALELPPISLSVLDAGAQ